MDDDQDLHDGNMEVDDENTSGDEDQEHNEPDPGGLRKELYVDFDEETNIFNSSRDLSVPSDQIFLLVDNNDQSITYEIKKWIKRRVLFPTVLASSFLEAYGDAYHPPFPLFIDLGLWHLRADSVNPTPVEIPDLYLNGISESQIKRAYECVLVVLEAHIRLPHGLKKTDLNGSAGIPVFTQTELKDFQVIATSHTAMVGILFTYFTLLPVHDFFANLASVVKAKPSGKQLLVGTMEDKIQLCILYVLDQVSVCARKIRSGIISKKAFSEHYRYKDMLVWNCPTFCRMIWNGIAVGLSELWLSRQVDER